MNLQSQISKLDAATVGYGLLVLTIGLSIRVAVSFFSVLGGGLTTKERLFVALAWLPKATVQVQIDKDCFLVFGNFVRFLPKFEILS